MREMQKGRSYDRPFLQIYLGDLALNLDLDVDACRKLDALKRIDCLVVGLDDVDETLVDTHLEVLT